MKSQIISALCYVAISVFAGTVAAQTPENLKFKLGAYTFDLGERNGTCVLNYKNRGVKKSVTLDLLGPCKVIRRSNGTLKSFRYRDISASVFAIGGEVSANGKCKNETANETQFVIVKPRLVKLAAKNKNSVCLPEGNEEKDYWLSAHE